MDEAESSRPSVLATAIKSTESDLKRKNEPGEARRSVDIACGILVLGANDRL
jgi:hypothetical protein